VLVAVAQNGWAFEFASPELRSDRELVLAAVTQNGRALEFAAKEFRADRELVLAAVTQNGLALEFASRELTANDRELVVAAVAQNGWAVGFVSEQLRADKDLMLEAVTRDGCALYFASPELWAERELVLAAVRQDAWAIGAVWPGLLVDSESAPHLLPPRDLLFEALRACYHSSSSLKTRDEARSEALRLLDRLRHEEKGRSAMKTRNLSTDDEHFSPLPFPYSLEPMLAFANHLAFAGTLRAPICVLREAYPNNNRRSSNAGVHTASSASASASASSASASSCWRCAGTHGLNGVSFSVELISTMAGESPAPTFARLSEALVDGSRGRFLFLVVDSDGGQPACAIDPLDGERPIPLLLPR